uniref:Uncharacterized protein n=1 Tax=Sphaerodactylus townsendi TaxID=933632 RepID=A0ACB8FWX0_9SAUR
MPHFSLRLWLVGSRSGWSLKIQGLAVRKKRSQSPVGLPALQGPLSSDLANSWIVPPPALLPFPSSAKGGFSAWLDYQAILPSQSAPTVKGKKPTSPEVMHSRDWTLTSLRPT